VIGANPEDPGGVEVSQPSNALVAQADAKSAFSTLFLGLGAVALLVGAIGVANIMVISALERRSEIAPRPGRHPRPHPHPVPGRSNRAIGARLHRRDHRRRGCHRHLRS
jgi:hypothetical protein